MRAGRHRSYYYSKRITQNPVKKLNKIEDRKKEFLIFQEKTKKYLTTIKFTKSIDCMLKNFNNIKEESLKIMVKYPDIYLELLHQKLNLQTLDADIKKCQDLFVKDFLLHRINIELKNEKEVTEVFLKESCIKKALRQAMKGIEYLPEETEFKNQISYLEHFLLDCYKN